MVLFRLSLKKEKKQMNSEDVSIMHLLMFAQCEADAVTKFKCPNFCSCNGTLRRTVH